MQLNDQKIADAVLALLAAFSFDEGRAWKGFDFEVIDQLFADGFVLDPKGKTKSLQLTPAGLQRGRELAQHFFGAP